jgi:hypothetical protein
MKNATVGQKVICNGFEGRITKVCDGQLEGMVEVRMSRGSVCVQYAHPDCFPIPEQPEINGSRKREERLDRAWEDLGHTLRQMGNE